MWQDSGRYEWPLTGPYPLSIASAPLVQVVPVQTPDQVVTIAAPTDTWHTLDGTALVTNPYERWYDPVKFTGSPISSAGIALDTQTYPEQTELADLRRQVEELRARVVELEQAAERHAGTL